jgi:hypothetical protein
MNTEVLSVGSIVKMNPFTIDMANRFDCDLFEGESEVVRINPSGTFRVKNSNNWKREHILVKGVDYDD